MNRSRQVQCEAVGEALGRIPGRLRHLVECDLFCADPLFAGINVPEWRDDAVRPDGRSYRRTPHVCFPYHVSDRRVTVVLPRDCQVSTVLHELGHVAHWHLQERAGGWERVPGFEPVTDYATTNRLEEFAEAWTQWFYGPEIASSDPYWTGWSRSNSEWFDRLLA